MVKRLIAITILVLFPFSVNLHGGHYLYKDRPLWRLEQYKYTTLLRQEPLCWCPFKAYVLVERYVAITNRSNYNVLDINADLIALTASDVAYNKAHTKRYKGKAKTKVKKIYRYCERTEYKIHVKYAKDVFLKRQGDCAGISEAFYVLCKKNHIPVRYVIGFNGDTCHAWNRVKIKGKWYWIDCTMSRWLSRELWQGYSVMEMW